MLPVCLRPMHHYADSKRNAQCRRESRSTQTCNAATEDVKEPFANCYVVAKKRTIDPHNRDLDEDLSFSGPSWTPARDCRSTVLAVP